MTQKSKLANDLEQKSLKIDCLDQEMEQKSKQMINLVGDV